LDKLPDSEDTDDKAIKEAYKRLWTINGDDQYKDLQVRVFQIITGARESLTPKQLLEFAHFDPRNTDNYENIDLDELEGLYCNFLKTNNNGYLDFEHLSARIFVSEKMEEERLGTSDLSIETTLTRSCLRCLSAIDFKTVLSNR
jgi:hypothetical protein